MQSSQQENGTAELAVKEVIRAGSFSDGRHTMFRVPDSHELAVINLQTAKLVAYSSSKADFENSLAEFAIDYFGK